MNTILVINPGATPFSIGDVEQFYAALPPGAVPMVDVGGYYLLPLEVVRMHVEDRALAELAELAAADPPALAAA